MTGPARADSEKGIAMTSDAGPARGSGTTYGARPLRFDTSMANQARMYNHLLGGCFR